MADQLNSYEFTYIVNAVLSDEQVKDVVARVSTLVTDGGGEIIEVNEWGSRRLAFPLSKKRNGYYVNMYFKAPGDLIQRLERALGINDSILRYLTLRMDAKMLRHYERRKAQVAEAAAEAECE